MPKQQVSWRYIVLTNPDRKRGAEYTAGRGHLMHIHVYLLKVVEILRKRKVEAHVLSYTPLHEWGQITRNSEIDIQR